MILKTRVDGIRPQQNVGQLGCILAVAQFGGGANRGFSFCLLNLVASRKDLYFDLILKHV